jgi:apolipoprotein N-acyltransferase
VYYWFLSGYSLWIFFRREGYPFLNPGIPLARYPIFLWLVAKMGLAWQGILGYEPVPPCKPADITFVYCPPVCVANPGHQTPVELGQAVYHRLTNLVLPDYDIEQGTTVIVAPETFYPASLNLHQEQCRLWCSGLPSSVHFILGSQATVGRKYYQTAYWLHKGLIKKYYVKKHQVPFVEKIPRGWRSIPLIKETFLKDNEQFSKDRRPIAGDLFEITPEVVFLPQLCSEFFFKTPVEKIWAGRQKVAGQHFYILFLVNDSWFVQYFRQLLQDLTAVKAAFLRMPVIYIGHAGLKKF